jgi:hypothetical protein
MNRSPLLFSLLAAVALTPAMASAQQAGNNTLLCNGRNDYIAASSLPSTANDFTIELWINPLTPHEIDRESTEGFAGVKGEHYVLYPLHGTYCWGAGHAGVGISAGTNGISVYEHAGEYLPALLVYEGKISGWTHVAVVYRDRQPSLYVNGVLVKKGLRSPQTFVHPSAGKAPVGSLVLGGIGGGNFGYYQGGVDDFRIWSRPLGESEIRSQMRSTLSGKEPGLIVNFDMNRSGAGAGLDLTNNGTATSSQPSPLSAGAKITGGKTFGTERSPVFVPREESAQLEANPVTGEGQKLEALTPNPQRIDIPIPVSEQGGINTIFGTPGDEHPTPQINIDLGSSELKKGASPAIEGMTLEQNQPNPFSTSTTIGYSIAEPGNVMLKIYDASGREVHTAIDEMQEAGHHEATIRIADIPASGTYYYRLMTGDRVMTRTMTVMK